MSAETVETVDTEAPSVEPEAAGDREAGASWLVAVSVRDARSTGELLQVAQQKITSQGQQQSELRTRTPLTAELEALLEARHVMEDRVAVLERGLLQRLVGRRPGASERVRGRGFESLSERLDRLEQAADDWQDDTDDEPVPRRSSSLLSRCLTGSPRGSTWPRSQKTHGRLY